VNREDAPAVAALVELGRIATELDDIELDGDVEYAHSHFVCGVKHLPVAYSFR